MTDAPETKKAGKMATDKPSEDAAGERIAKVMARAGLCSRRDAEAWIAEGRVSLNGKKLRSPAVNVQPHDDIRVDGKPLPEAEKTRLFRYHKPRGLVTTAKDPEGRPTVFENLPDTLPRVISVGRLDLNSEGLLLLTNDGELARRLELPATGWVRRYRVRVNGRIDPASLTRLAGGIEIEGVRYGAIEAILDRQQGDNAWLTMSLTEGKNREIRKVCAFFGWTVSRLIRLSYGPFQLGHLERGEIEEVPGKVLRDQLGQPGAAQALRPHQAQGGKSRPPKQLEGKPRSKQNSRDDRVYRDDEKRSDDRKPKRIWKYVAPTEAAGGTASDRIAKDIASGVREPRGAARTGAKPAGARPVRGRPVGDRPATEKPTRERSRRDDDRQPRRDDDRKPRFAARPERDQDRRPDDRKPERSQKHAEPKRGSQKPNRQKPAGTAPATARQPREWAGKNAASDSRKSAGGKPTGRVRRDGDTLKMTPGGPKPADAKPGRSKLGGGKPVSGKPGRSKTGDQRPSGGPGKHAHRQRRP